MLQLKDGAGVFTSDGRRVGDVDRFVLDPATQEVTHIVVKKGWLLPEDKVVPMAMVRSATPDRVLLKEDAATLEALPPFESKHFVEAPDAQDQPGSGARPAYYWYPPLGRLGYPAYGLAPYLWPPVETRRNIPKYTVPLKEGSEVICSDDRHVGRVERLFLEADSDKVSHLLVLNGLLPDRKLVPANWIGSVDEHSVHLTVPSGVVRGLRPYEP